MQGRTFQVSLSGEIYERAGQWWWRVRLPGEDAIRARLLKAPGAPAAAVDRNGAEKVALEMWEQAVRQEGSRQITLDCTQKIEKLKAQFLDKVRHLTEIVQTATAKAQAEAQARAEIEARLNAMTEAAKLQMTMPSSRIETPTLNPQTLVACESAAEATHPPQQTSLCECCGAADIPTSDLTQIESGQWLCRDCLEAFHSDASRAEADLAASFA